MRKTPVMRPALPHFGSVTGDDASPPVSRLLWPSA